ncbi:MAG: efflux RND transporter periplasmic adaptor subunit [Polyangiaceae bacterium]|nr:efflux RND transporter periplasmic adaptor subunit [Polyangiaceae bacterium]
MTDDREDESLARAARGTLVVIALVIAVLSAVFVLRRGAHGDQRYTCPMVEHAFVVSDEPGECPLCHMKLVALPAAAVEARKRELPPSPVPGVAEVSLHGDQLRRAGVRTEPAQTRTLTAPLVVTAEIVASEEGRGRVHARAAGFIERVVVSRVGARVKAGEVVAYLYSPEIYRAMEELIAAARLEEAGAVGAREAATRRLKLFGVGDREIATILEKRAPTRLVAVRAPSAGVVLRKEVATGAYVTPEMPLFELVDTSRSYALAEVPPGLGLEAGAKATLAIGDARVDAVVELTLVEAARDSRATRVKLVPVDRAVTLRPGAPATASFELGPQTRVTVPESALVETGKQAYVFVDTGETLRPVAVTPGRRAQGRVEIERGLDAGANVVVSGTFLVDAESRLTAAISGGAAPSASAP